ncbi:hypothetical protein BpHYR1_047881 [Brachionus plicatilis]|uniref:Uncharacterized protein n=1 Tax=Brachionus plicatilis TaxID=10195 RepID=A0A3M7T942_BRAPC|nr:hypothetical protein BpHYR1_047881 [Brachionus plicatilis]
MLNKNISYSQQDFGRRTTFLTLDSSLVARLCTNSNAFMLSENQIRLRYCMTYLRIQKLVKYFFMKWPRPYLNLHILVSFC